MSKVLQVVGRTLSLPLQRKTWFAEKAELDQLKHQQDAARLELKRVSHSLLDRCI